MHCVFIGPTCISQNNSVFILMKVPVDVKELPIDSALGLLATINITRTHSVAMEDNGDFETTPQIFYFSHDRLEILHTGRE